MSYENVNSTLGADFRLANRVAMRAAAKDRADGDADPHGKVGRHREDVGLSPDTVRAEITTFHVHS